MRFPLLLSAGLSALVVAVLLPLVAWASWLALNWHSEQSWLEPVDLPSAGLLAVFGLCIAAPISAALAPLTLTATFRYSRNPVYVATLVGALIGAVAWIGVPKLLGVTINPDYLAMSLLQGGALGSAAAFVGATFYKRIRGAA